MEAPSAAPLKFLFLWGVARPAVESQPEPLDGPVLGSLRGQCALGQPELLDLEAPDLGVALPDHAAAKEDVQHAVRERDPEVGRLEVDELRLTESTLTPEGPEYRTVERFRL